LPTPDGKARRLRERRSAVPLLGRSTPRVHRFRDRAAYAVALVAMLARPDAAQASFYAGDLERIPGPFTSTLAGSGARGITDGPAANATFMTPAGIATTSDGAAIVADPAAQNVRRIFAGRVTTLAGTSTDGSTPDERAGGYADGPANQARFDRPVAVAVARNGDVYVADAGNRCIRRISHGFVTTFSGSRAPGHADGGARIAQFDDLRGLAVDDAGLLYVADYGVGLRRIDANGNVTTITRPSDAKTVLSVAARGAGDRAIVAYADATRFHIVANGKTQDVAYVDGREPGLPELAVGRANGLAIVNENTLVASDTATNAVRLIRLPAPPFLTDRMSRALAGGVREGADLTGGYADGPSDRAELDTPSGVALGRNGTIFVADTGNRRIREIAGVDARESVLPDASNLSIPRKGYRIAIVGNSYAFYNVLWPESIPGRIETVLARDAHAVDLRARANLTVFRVDDLSATAGRSLVREYLGDGQVDLVILLVNAYGPWSVDDLRALAIDLAAKRTQLMIVYTPQGFEVSPLDFPTATLDHEVGFTALHAQAVKSELFYAGSGIESLLLLDRMEAWEGSAQRRPLYYGADHHLTIFGSQWVGERIAEALERWRPWRRRAS
jgi:sugar lactone lactonase YvrE